MIAYRWGMAIEHPHDHGVYVSCKKCQKSKADCLCERYTPDLKGKPSFNPCICGPMR